MSESELEPWDREIDEEEEESWIGLFILSVLLVVGAALLRYAAHS